MAKWNVLMTTADYVVVKADTPEQAEREASRLYEMCEIRPQYPSFVCEEVDRLEE